MCFYPDQGYVFAYYDLKTITKVMLILTVILELIYVHNKEKTQVRSPDVNKMKKEEEREREKAEDGQRWRVLPL